MATRFIARLVLAAACWSPALAWSQDVPSSVSPAATVAAPDVPVDNKATAETVRKEGAELVQDTRQHVDQIARQVNQDPRAQEASAGILRPIYMLAEYLSFSAFHWVAFAVMVAGVVSYAFQLVLGKLVVLARLSLSPSEILSDAMGLVISLFGLVLTTQAATENSTFTQSPAAVLSATAAGAIAGLIFYRWGQAQELQAAAGRARVTPPAKR